MPESDRMHAIRDYLEVVAPHDTVAKEYINRGSHRPTSPLTDSERELATEIQNAHNLEPKQCWWNCQLITGAYPEFQYVEGYTISESVPIPIHHAWLERNDKVWEFTFPDGPDVRDSAVYYGIPIDEATVTDQVETLESAHPIIRNPHTTPR